MNEKFCILIENSLKLVPKGPIDNESASVKIIIIIWTNADPIYWLIYVALGGDELIVEIGSY